MPADSGAIFAAKWVIFDAFHSHENHAIYVSQGKICDLAPFSELRSRYPEATLHKDESTVIAPGFVNAHHHCFGVNLVNQGILDDVLEPWILSAAGAADISSRTATEYASLRLLKSGVTAVVDCCTAAETVALSERKIREKIQVFSSLGLACAVAPGERWQNRLVHPDGQDQAFLASLPESLRGTLQRKHISRKRLEPENYVNLISRLHEEYRGTDTVDIWFGPTAPHWTGRRLLRDIGRTVREKGVRVQTHAEESLLQHRTIGGADFPASISELAQSGLLSENLSLAHMVWADDKDLNRVADMGAHIVCNPSSNLRLRCGIARAPRMKSLGINLALGMDGTSLANDDDMFAEMRLARNLYWSDDPTQPDLSAQDVFDMATMGGARLMGMDQHIGSLSIGKRADFQIVNLNRLKGPWLAEHVDPVELLVSSAKATDIQKVYTGGSLAVVDGETCGRDEHDVLQNVAEEMQRATDQKLSTKDYATLRSCLMRWYENWLADNVRPA